MNRVVALGSVLLPFLLCVVNGFSQEELSELKRRLLKVEKERSELLEQIEKLEQKPSESPAKPQKKLAKDSQVWLKYYLDTREYSTFEIATSTNKLPWGLSFWGFTDLHGAQNQGDDHFDFDRFFMEYRLNKAIDPRWVAGLEGLGWELEYNDSNGRKNHLIRAGLTYKHAIPSFAGRKGWLKWRAHPVESDGNGGQVSVIINWPISSRIWLSGFADYNIIEGADERWVIEPQLNYRISEDLHFLIEYRFNQIEEVNPSLEGEGVAFGLAYSF